MTREEAIKQLKECQKNKDAEDAHRAADGILCELLESLGYGDVIQEWNIVCKWYS